jgi:hypothetical protein
MDKKWKRVNGSNVGKFCLYADKDRASVVVVLDEYFTPVGAPDGLRCMGWDILDEADCAAMFNRMREKLNELEHKALRVSRRINAARDKAK